ncbi:hypothetical protein [Streptomyces sp. NPDC056796]|uniref:hypothetical protein n=1 Tax=Streptomyces sp. NPDC056796 TaxID=3345947 RepID=UPI0036C9D09E
MYGFPSLRLAGTIKSWLLPTGTRAPNPTGIRARGWSVSNSFPGTFADTRRPRRNQGRTKRPPSQVLTPLRAYCRQYAVGVRPSPGPAPGGAVRRTVGPRPARGRRRGVTSPHDDPVARGNLCIKGRFGFHHVQNRD